jgi:hypothetical protein
MENNGNKDVIQNFQIRESQYSDVIELANEYLREKKRSTGIRTLAMEPTMAGLLSEVLPKKIAELKAGRN